MTMRDLPAAKIATKPGLRSELVPGALDRWNPEVRAAADESENTISILEPIGADWFGEGVTAKRIATALRNIGNVEAGTGTAKGSVHRVRACQHPAWAGDSATVFIEGETHGLDASLFEEVSP